jgi:hypothetical protein
MNYHRNIRNNNLLRYKGRVVKIIDLVVMDIPNIFYLYECNFSGHYRQKGGPDYYNIHHCDPTSPEEINKKLHAIKEHKELKSETLIELKYKKNEKYKNRYLTDNECSSDF